MHTSSPRRRGTAAVIGVVSVAVIALSLVGLVALGILRAFDPFGTEEVDRSGATVVERIRDLEEFTAAEGSFTQDVDIEEDARWVPDFIRGERAVIIVSGTVRATVDLGGLDADAVTVDDEAGRIRLVLPEPTLSDAEIDESSARVVSRSRGLLDRVGDLFAENPTDDAELYEAAEDKVNDAARESDLIEQARANTEEWMETFLGAAGFDEVEISWQDRSE